MESFDKTWEQIHKETVWGKYPSEDVIRFMARNFYRANRPEIRVLDVGCGGGANTWYLAAEGFDTYAFDGSPTAVEKAKKLVTSFGVSANIIVSDAANLPYEDGFFDAVIDSAVIYANTTENINRIFTECHRILKNNGLLFCTGLFNTETSGINSGKEIEQNTYADLTEGCLAGRGTVHFFTREELELTINKNGFEVCSIDKLTRTDHDGKDTVSYFILIAQKR
jgi:2-polyprenyl-3-methyl-5-hydroxy-6-metoxy-1,4-benzoquinol methylase